MFDPELRIVKHKLLSPLAQNLNVSATYLTGLGFAVGLLSVMFAWQGRYGLALIAWLLNRFLDGLDGEVSRLKNQQSDWGGYLDILADFVIYALLPIALMVSNTSLSGWFALAFMLACFYINAASWMYLSALLEKRQSSQGLTSITMPKGLIEGGETIIIYCLFIIFYNYLPILYSLMALLVIVTIFQRISWAESVVRVQGLGMSDE
jgi:phosphatidylglycerophosphate synthase